MGGLSGGAVGCEIGSQIGKGNGRVAGAAVGAATGAIVGDRIEWKNPKQKSQGYTLVEGQKTDTVTLSKRDGRG